MGFWDNAAPTKASPMRRKFIKASVCPAHMSPLFSPDPMTTPPEPCCILSLAKAFSLCMDFYFKEKKRPCRNSTVSENCIPLSKLANWCSFFIKYSKIQVCYKKKKDGNVHCSGNLFLSKDPTGVVGFLVASCQSLNIWQLSNFHDFAES